MCSIARVTITRKAVDIRFAAGELVRRLISIAAICGLCLASVNGQPATAKPNIVLIITDDVGYGDLGSYGAPDIKTPNIDSLAKQGARLTDFYANGSSCTPTRGCQPVSALNLLVSAT